VAVAAFTLVLWLAGRDQLAELRRQVDLSRDEFEASHRPWVAVRQVSLKIPGVHIDDAVVEISAEYKLENTSTVPALDLLLIGGAIPAVFGEQALRKYIDDTLIEGMPVSAGSMLRPKPQNQVIFPGETTNYHSTFKLKWRDEDNGLMLDAHQLESILVVAAFFYAVSWNNKRVMYTACVHEIRPDVTDAHLQAAIAGTGIMLNGQIDRWNIGWSVW
jgi:hypothetical protein